MGENIDSLKTKDFNHLRTLAQGAEHRCIAVADSFKAITTTLPTSLPDTVRYAMVTVSTLLSKAYLSRADAMRSAQRFFEDSLGTSFAELTNNLQNAMLLSDQAATGFKTLKQYVTR